MVAMLRGRLTDGHASWNQWGPVNAPHPQEPDASEVSWNCGRLSGRMLLPFQTEMKVCHQQMSERASLLSRSLKSGLRTTFVRSMRRLRNGRPGRTTVAA